ncbi:MAG: T9SS type A sorting domain-containing protein, partial [Bacteroidia bacterium]|nr:T9SS type A sorting domain-containing protein [Bacteroidia bacterium]
SQTEPPVVECYETATFNSDICQWIVTGEKPTRPVTACYETATFNNVTCQWDVTGDMPARPVTACYESATFNHETCKWDVTGTQPERPVTACYETATFNHETCKWDVTGTQPERPVTACYETATFNHETCKWDVTGTQPERPVTACYETATFNTQTCKWDVTGTQPERPVTACYETATFNAQTCAWDVTGTQPERPVTACYETATFNAQTCAWDVTGEPNAPIVTTADACDSYVWAVNGQTYSASGVYNYSANCQDYTLNLTITNCNEGCYAAEVYYFNQGLTKLGTAPNPERSIPTNALGAPDGQNPPVYAPVQNFVSLGFGGEIQLAFAYPIANGPGADIKIWESSASVNAETARIEVSQDGLGYTSVGTISQTGEVDFDAAFSDYIRFVRIVDISNPALFANNQVQDGFDVDAVECLHGEYVPKCTATEIILVDQGTNAVGGPVTAIRSNPALALGPIESEIVGTVNFFSLGFGGKIIVAFDGPIANGPGDDVKIGEITWNNDCTNYPERVDVMASQDGVSFVTIGQLCHDGSLDLGPLAWAKFIQLVDVSDPSKFPADADGYDISGIECLNGDYVPQGCYATRVVAFDQKKNADGSDVLAVRSDANQALGAPEAADPNVVNYVSLGFGGSIVLGFDGPVANGSGDDIKIHEITFGYNCGNYPETVEVFASQDGVSYVYLGSNCMTSSFDLGSLSWAQFIKIVDVSDASLFPANADGYDVNGIECLNGPAEDPGDDGLEPCTMQAVVIYAPGNRKNGLPLAAERADANNALGAPQNNDTYNFASLGFGGSITLGYDFVVFNLSGNDIKVVETSFGSPNCSRYPEEARIEASKDLVSWTDLGIVCLDGEVDLGPLSWAQYVRVTDVSDITKFSGNDDGFDVDAVVVINGGCKNFARFAENTSTNMSALSINAYPNPASEYTVLKIDGTRNGENWTVDIMDAAGRLVERKSFPSTDVHTEFMLNVSSYEAGIYQIIATNGTDRLNQRLVK